MSRSAATLVLVCIVALASPAHATTCVDDATDVVIAGSLVRDAGHGSTTGYLLDLDDAVCTRADSGDESRHAGRMQIAFLDPRNADQTVSPVLGHAVLCSGRLVRATSANVRLVDASCAPLGAVGLVGQLQ